MTINYFAANAFASNHFASDQLAGGASVPADGCYFGSYQFQANYFGNYYFCGEGVPVPPTPTPSTAAIGGGGGGGWNCFPRPWYDGRNACESEEENLQLLERFHSWRSSRKTHRKTAKKRRAVKARMISGTKRIVRVDRRQEQAPAQIVVAHPRLGIGGILVAVAVGALIGYLIARSASSSKSSKRKKTSRRR